MMLKTLLISTAGQRLTLLGGKRRMGREPAQPRPESTAYKIWRHHFLTGRLALCFRVALLCFLITAIEGTLATFFPDFQAYPIQNLNPVWLEVRQTVLILSIGATGSLLLLSFMVQQTAWGYRHPAAAFLCISWAFTLAPQIVRTFFHTPGIRLVDCVLVFLGQATLLPVQWRLHLVSQVGAIAYFIGVNWLLGTTTEVSGYPLFNSFTLTRLFLACFICDLAVYLYEQLQRKEFEARQQLKIFLHSVSHDLKTPVMGTAIVLQSLLDIAEEEVKIKKSELQRLFQGTDRQLALINSLLETHAAEVAEIPLHCESLQLSAVVEAALSDLSPNLAKSQVTVINRISPELPPVMADAIQLRRVWSNLLTNALKHNPPGIELTLDAELISDRDLRSRNRSIASSSGIWTIKPGRSPRPQRWICCTVQDNGVGIPVQQQSRLFELYSRGSRARFMPGLGLGLYLCKQIVARHGGEIGVVSRPGEGTRFWFTLPLNHPLNHPLNQPLN